MSIRRFPSSTIQISRKKKKKTALTTPSFHLLRCPRIFSFFFLLGLAFFSSSRTADFYTEIASSVKYYWSTATVKKSKQRRPDLAQVFGAGGRTSGSSATPMTGFPSDRVPVLHAASPSPFSSPSLHSQADDANHIPLRMLEAKGSKKEMERYSKIGLAH